LEYDAENTTLLNSLRIELNIETEMTAEVASLKIHYVGHVARGSAGKQLALAVLEATLKGKRHIKQCKMAKDRKPRTASSLVRLHCLEMAEECPARRPSCLSALQISLNVSQVGICRPNWPQQSCSVCKLETIAH